MKNEFNARPTRNLGFQTKLRGSHCAEYKIYLDCADDGNGREFMTGRPLKTYEEWLAA